MLPVVLLVKQVMRSKEEIRQQMFSMLDQWQQSGLSQKAWCIQSGIAYHVFHYWYKRYRDRSNALQNHSFVELKVQSCAMAGIELILPDGRRLLFHQSVSSDYLKAIIS